MDVYRKNSKIISDRLSRHRQEIEELKAWTQKLAQAIVKLREISDRDACADGSDLSLANPAEEIFVPQTEVAPTRPSPDKRTAEEVKTTKLGWPAPAAYPSWGLGGGKKLILTR